MSDATSGASTETMELSGYDVNRRSEEDGAIARHIRHSCGDDTNCARRLAKAKSYAGLFGVNADIPRNPADALDTGRAAPDGPTRPSRRKKMPIFHVAMATPRWQSDRPQGPPAHDTPTA
ncbi:hypothetical protein EVAR_54564_1 [Eumeta japonica]|uniref:Uncharacterized protein n=1 Tax=Eumeta variegata TaxID=151549 RepID=A0A4C1YCV3_EUMVA|nr:hypothetical protein EVAR_54564_1 [Eumeta japonica]